MYCRKKNRRRWRQRVAEVRQLVAAVRELVEAIAKHGLDVNPTVGETEIPSGRCECINKGGQGK